MSHINDALKKVQKEKDSLYQRYGNIISDPVYHRTGRGKRWMITGSVIVLILLALSVFILLRYNASSGTDNSNMAIIQDAEKDEHRTPARLASPSASAKPARHSPEAKPMADGPRDAGRGESVAGRSNVQHRTSNEKKKQKKVPEIPAKTGDVKRLYNEALNFQRNGNPAMAEKVYRKILAIDPGFVMGLNNLGVICMSQKKNKEAADMFRKAIDLKADYVDPYYNLACLYSLSGNISKSLYYLKMAVSINNSVKNWAKNDKDMERLRASETYSKIME